MEKIKVYGDRTELYKQLDFIPCFYVIIKRNNKGYYDVSYSKSPK